MMKNAGEADGLPLDLRREDVVLELLVDEHDDEHDHGRRQALLGPQRGHEDEPGDGGADVRDHVEQAGDHAQADGIARAEQPRGRACVVPAMWRSRRGRSPSARSRSSPAPTRRATARPHRASHARQAPSASRCRVSRKRQMKRIVKPARNTPKKSPAIPSTAEIASGIEPRPARRRPVRSRRRRNRRARKARPSPEVLHDVGERLEEVAHSARRAGRGGGARAM